MCLVVVLLLPSLALSSAEQTPGVGHHTGLASDWNTGKLWGYEQIQSQPRACRKQMKGFFVVPRVQRERASGVHLALLAHRDLLALAMRGARVPQDLRDLQDLPPSQALTDRVRM